MTDSAILPAQRAALVDSSGTTTPEFYRFFRGLSATAQLPARVDDLTVRVAKLEDGYAPGAGSVVGQQSVVSQGILANGVVSLNLQGDITIAPALSFYGALNEGGKGWQTLSENFAKRDNGDGTASLDLADLPDSGTGALLAIERDGKGRVSGTRDVTEADLPTLTATALVDLTYPRVVSLDGAGNAYYPDLTNPDDVSRIVGVTAHAAATGAPVQIVTSRDFTEPAWSWSPGRIYCALTGGALTQSVPLTGAIVEVARVVSPTTIRVGIQPAILR